MESLYGMRKELEEKFVALIKSGASEEKFSDLIATTLRGRSNSCLDVRLLDVILDLALSVVDDTTGCCAENYHYARNTASSAAESPLPSSSASQANLGGAIYDADDEGLDETFVFPCHLNFNDCHPELLSHYHRDNLKSAISRRSSTQLIKYPRICQLIIKYIFDTLREKLSNDHSCGTQKGPKAGKANCQSGEQQSRSIAGEENEIEQNGTNPPVHRDHKDSEKDALDYRDNEDDDDDDELLFNLTKSSSSSSLSASSISSASSSCSISGLLNNCVAFIRKVNKICLTEKSNCRILARSNILQMVLEATAFLLDETPSRQYIYLEPMLQFAFTLADYQLTGAHLRQFLSIIKNENTDLRVALGNLEKLLNHHYRILRNIQPLKSINFPTASKTAEEIERYDLYVANSWHWRLRSKVIEFKRKRSRTESQSLELKARTGEQVAASNPLISLEPGLSLPPQGSKSQAPVRNQASGSRITSSWLECSMMTPLSNISPLIHNGELQFCCSWWMSVCGDLLVVDTSGKTPTTNSPSSSSCFIPPVSTQWSSSREGGAPASNGHWLRMTSRRRLARRFRNKAAAAAAAAAAAGGDGSVASGNAEIGARRPKRTRRESYRLRQRQIHDKEDEEHEENDERVRKSEAESNNQTMTHNGRRLKLFQASPLPPPPTRLSAPSSNFKAPPSSPEPGLFGGGGGGRQRAPANNGLGGRFSRKSPQSSSSPQPPPPREFLGRRARDNSQELLLHIVSFAIDSLTIEIWLNVKWMTFCARACRVTREGQTNLLDQVTFASHLEANGSWSNVIFCLEERPISAANNKTTTSSSSSPPPPLSPLSSSSSSGSEKCMSLKVIVNGHHKESEKLFYSAHKSPLTNFALLIGCERSTFGYVWKLSQINVYKSIPDKSMPCYLLGKGPDLWSFTNFRQQASLILPDLTQRNINLLLIDRKLLAHYSQIDEDRLLNWLTQNIVLTFVAHQADYFLDYSPSMTTNSLMNPLPLDYEFSNSAERFIQAQTLNFSRTTKLNTTRGFGQALVEAGGIESILICFAEVIRRSPGEAASHSLALSILFKMSQTNLYHLAKFLDELNGLKLIEFILIHPQCCITRPMFESYFEFCCMKRAIDSSGSSRSTKAQPPPSYQLIKSAKLIFNLMTCWRAWHKDVRVAKLLYKRLIRLLQPPPAGASGQHSSRLMAQTRRHSRVMNGRQGNKWPWASAAESYYVGHNFRMITQAGGIDILMGILRECLVPLHDDYTPNINHELVELIVNLISLLIKHPPGLDVMLDIMDFLMFLHPDPKAYVEVVADRSAFLHPLRACATNNEDEDDDDDDDEEEEDLSSPLYEEDEEEGVGGGSRLSGALGRRPGRSPSSGGELASELGGGGGGGSGSRATTTFRSSVDTEEGEDYFRSTRRYGQRNHSEDLARFIGNSFRNFSPAAAGSPSASLPEAQVVDREQLDGGGDRRSSNSVRCSNRNFALASIADMLASIVKLTSSDPMKILSEALQKPIIDTRKLIILANNNCTLVREKVLRLFLYCVRACYSLKLQPILVKHHQDSASANYKINIPIQLMARQLLKYQTSARMIQLCYGIIVGIDDFEAVERVCLSFDIDLTNNHLQLNTLALLIQLMTRLQLVHEMVPALKFVHAYLRQLLRLGEWCTVSVLINNNLVDCLMRLYFVCVEHLLLGASTATAATTTTKRANHGRRSPAPLGELQTRRPDSAASRDQREQTNKQVVGENYGLVLDELDKLLVFVVRFYAQHSVTTEMALKSLDELLLYVDLLNAQVPVKFHYYLRERKVKILSTLLGYCRHYEQCARDRPHGGVLKYYLTSLMNLKSNELNKFGNALSECQLSNLLLSHNGGGCANRSKRRRAGGLEPNEGVVINGRGAAAAAAAATAGTNDGGARMRQHRHSGSERASPISSGEDNDSDGSASAAQLSEARNHLLLADEQNGYSRANSSGGGDDDEEEDDDDELNNLEHNCHQDEGHTRDISETSVLERFVATLEFVVNFIITRQAGVIPSPMERQFVLSFISQLAGYLDECSGKQNNHSPLLLSNGEQIDNKQRGRRSQWNWMLTSRLEPHLRASFARLILYLLSPCEAMNLDERKYNAHKLFELFSVGHLLELLDDHQNDASQSTLKVLNVFIKDLISFGSSTAGASKQSDNEEEEEEDDDDEDEVMHDCTEAKLKNLIRGIEYELGIAESTARRNKTGGLNGIINSKRSDSAQMESSKMDNKFRAIWLADLAQLQEEARERLLVLRATHQQIAATAAAAAGVAQQVSTAGTTTTAAAAAAGAETATVSATMDSSRRVQCDEPLEVMLDEAASITRDVVNDKNEQRKAYFEDVKQEKVYNYHIRQQWLSLIIGHTHERANWHLHNYYPNSWELNPVEGPSRTRRRLRPTKMLLEPRFLRNHQRSGEAACKPFHGGGTRQMSASDNGMGGGQQQASGRENEEDEAAAEKVEKWRAIDCQRRRDALTYNHSEWHNQYSPHPLCSLVVQSEQSMDSNELRIRMFTSDKIHFNCDCSIVRPNEVCEGEVSIASRCIHFIGERTNSSTSNHFQQQQMASKPFNGGHSRTRPPCTPPVGVGRTNTTNTMTAAGATGVATIVEDLWFDEIVEIWDRRYQLQDVGLEIFLTNNMTYLLSFRSHRDRDDFKQQLMREQHKMINLQRFNLNASLTRLTQLWRDGKLTNFDYLTRLNKLAGRSFNDLMQYPVFPFVLADYTSPILDLNQPKVFRKLKRPVAIQNEERENNFKNNYKLSQSATYLAATSATTGCGSSGASTPCATALCKPYHYSNHYSNSATVLHFLVRVAPFTQMLIQYQDNNFDQPDRTFHSIASTWQLITRDSNTDFKELIPEFFFLPEMFINLAQLELGRKQNNELVDDVRLPPWTPNSDARLFTMIHRQALESAHVSESLHHWVDLIFGYKQTGKPAIEAINVFHPATYYGEIDLAAKSVSGSPPSLNGGGGRDSNRFLPQMSNLSLASSNSTATTATTSPMQAAIAAATADSLWRATSSNGGGSGSNSCGTSSLKRALLTKRQQADIERLALETMIKTYGQMPKQLFNQPVKQRSLSTFVAQLNENKLEKRLEATGGHTSAASLMGGRTRLEPLRQVRGLRWGSFVGSPDEPGEIKAVKHKHIVPPQESTTGGGAIPTISGTSSATTTTISPLGGASAKKHTHSYRKRSLNLQTAASQQQQQKFHLCLLANGDIAILRNTTSLMLDYHANRKSGGTNQLSILPSTRYSRLAGLSQVARMNLFANMIISRQQFSFLEPIIHHSPFAHSSASYQSELPTGGGSGGGVGGGSYSSSPGDGRRSNSRTGKFSPDSLSLVSWFYLDGTIRVRHPATNPAKPSIPLVQANTIVDTMTTCCSVAELNLLLVGYQSGSICAHIVSTTYETIQQHHHPAHFPPSPNSAQLSSSSSSPGSGVASVVSTQSQAATGGGSGFQLISGAPPAGEGGAGIGKTLTGEPYRAVTLAGKSLQSVRHMNKTSRWLYCHRKRINCIKINVSFGIVVTTSNDGTSVIWDLNSLTYVRTIDYKLASLRLRNRDRGHTVNSSNLTNEQTPVKEAEEDGEFSWSFGRASKQRVYDYLCDCGTSTSGSSSKSAATTGPRQCCICSSGVTLVAISDTLGDIVTIKDISNRWAVQTNDSDGQNTSAINRFPSGGGGGGSSSISSDSLQANWANDSELNNGLHYGSNNGNDNGNENEDDDDDDDEMSLTSVLYVHTINGNLVGFVNCHTQVTAVCYSSAPEGISVNVIVVGMADGLVRLYSSWDLNRIKEFRMSGLGSPIGSMLYTRDNQFLYIAYEDGQLVVLRNEKKGSYTMPKVWYL